MTMGTAMIVGKGIEGLAAGGVKVHRNHVEAQVAQKALATQRTVAAVECLATVAPVLLTSGKECYLASEATRVQLEQIGAWREVELARESTSQAKVVAKSKRACAREWRAVEQITADQQHREKLLSAAAAALAAGHINGDQFVALLMPTRGAA